MELFKKINRNFLLFKTILFFIISVSYLKAQFFSNKTYYISSLYFTRSWIKSESSIEHLGQNQTFISKLWGLNYDFFYTNYSSFGMSFYGRSQLIGDALYLLIAIIDGRKIRPYSNTLLELTLPVTLLKRDYLAFLVGPSFNFFAFEIPQETSSYNEPFTSLPLGVGPSATLDISFSSSILLRTYAVANFYTASKAELPTIYNGWVRLYIKQGFFIGIDIIKLPEIWNQNTNEKINCLRKDLVIGFALLE
ncbi:MAG: hypothetical protein N3A01_08375 [Bacteroidales bacterium]|nr:hypothetical protein [Bacteroidales bacterium]